MSLHDFWSHVRIGAKLVAPQVSVVGPRLDAGAVETVVRNAHLWLTPKSVAGFDPADFAFLDPEEQKRLSDSVERFRGVARTVPATAPPTAAQIESALPPFREIVEMLDFERYGDAEAYRIGKRIERMIRDDRPEWVADLRFETGSDASGDPAVWVWVVMADEAAEGDGGTSNARAARALLDGAAREAAPDRWPYIRFQTVSEQAELAGVE